MKILIIGQNISAGGGVVEVERAMLDNFQTSQLDCGFISTTPKKGKSALPFLLALFKLVLQATLNRPNIAHLHMASRGSTYRKIVISAILRLFRLPYIVHIHSGEFLDFFQNSPTLVKKIIIHTLKSSKQVIVLSELIKSHLKININIKNCTVVYNGCTDMLSQASDTPHGKKEIVFVGRVNDKKGIGDLIEAMHIICQARPTTRLTIVGDGELEFYRSCAAAKGLADNVTFTGWMSKSSCADELLRHHIFVLPSYYEGLPISILEAMSAEMAIIATNVGGIPEIIKHQHNGILINPQSPCLLAAEIVKLLDSPDLRSRLARRARQDYEQHFSNARMCSDFLKLYLDT